MTQTDTVRRRVARALVLTLLLAGFASTVSCRGRGGEDDRGRRDFHHDDFHRDDSHRDDFHRDH